MSQIIRLLIADDHPVVRDGLRGIFEASGEFEVAGEAANGREAVDRAAALHLDVVLMDLRMPVLDGVSAIKALAEKGIGARVLVLTTFDTDTDVVPAIEAGATGYLLKDSPPDELRRGVRAAARGEAVLSPSVATRLLGQVRQPAREPLSVRELDILGLIAHGCSNREAAARLFISEATVKTHVLHIYAKLGVNDRAAAVAAGFERGLLPRPLKPDPYYPRHQYRPAVRTRWSEATAACPARISRTSRVTSSGYWSRVASRSCRWAFVQYPASSRSSSVRSRRFACRVPGSSGAVISSRSPGRRSTLPGVLVRRRIPATVSPVPASKGFQRACTARNSGSRPSTASSIPIRIRLRNRLVRLTRVSRHRSADPADWLHTTRFRRCDRSLIAAS